MVDRTLLWSSVLRDAHSHSSLPPIKKPSPSKNRRDSFSLFDDDEDEEVEVDYTLVQRGLLSNARRIVPSPQYHLILKIGLTIAFIGQYFTR